MIGSWSNLRNSREIIKGNDCLNSGRTGDNYIHFRVMTLPEGLVNTEEFNSYFYRLSEGNASEDPDNEIP
jgi:hypothetical protein